ncbi:hypothetical protein P8452_22812 [Trifolium repens]|nr:hypothetical protein P8452_22812 [Trifolium repens]
MFNDFAAVNICQEDSNNIDPRITTSSFGGSLSLNILLPMRRRNGVFLCMEVADKQPEFSLRMDGTKNYVITNLAVGLKQLLRFFPGFSR